jgi:hypothetical protein
MTATRRLNPNKLVYPSSDSGDELLASYHQITCGGNDYSSSSDDGLTTDFSRKPPANALSGVKKFYTIKRPDGFEERRAYSTNGAPIIRKHTQISEEQAILFSKKFNAYFYGLTKKKINFIITPTAQPYISMLEMCRHRDQYLMTLFDEQPEVWDLMGGSGADSYGFLLDLDPRRLVIVEKGTGSKEEISRESKALEHNMKEFCNCFQEYENAMKPSREGANDARVQIHHMTAKEFIEQANPSKEPKTIDMAFLDPSWDKAYDPEERPVGAEPENEYEISPTELFGYLDRHVWQPLRRNRITVDIFVIKTRWEWSRVQEELERINSDYLAFYSIQCIQFVEYLDKRNVGKYGEIRGQYHYMILKHKKYQVKQDNRSKWYFDLIRKGKRIYVDERTVVKPFKPRYVDHLKYPTVYYSPHEHCFEVTPPDFGKVKPLAKPPPHKPSPPPPPPTVIEPRPESPEEDEDNEQREPTPPELSPSSSGSESESESDDDEPTGYRGRFSHLPKDEAHLRLFDI